MIDSRKQAWIVKRRTGFLNNKRLPSLEINDESYKQYEHELSVKVDLNDAVKYLYPILHNYESEMDCLDIQDSAKTDHFMATSKKIVQLLWKLTEFCTNNTDPKHIESLKLIKDFCGEIDKKSIIRGNIGSFLRELEAGTLDAIKRQRYSNTSQKCIDDLLALFKDLDNPYVHAFFSDFSRISFSSAFRRLQDKAQVFPLEKHDYARTRLTHTIEVMSIVMQLANLTALRIGYDINNTEKKELAFLFEKCLNCAALLHDMGNPPYGHFGEDAIKDYFKKMWDELVLHTSSGEKRICNLRRDVSEDMYEQMKQDFTCFDGNAQSFRLASKTAQYKIGKPLDLTAAVLGSIIKYPCTSVEGMAHQKFGYFYSEMDTIDKLSCMGTYQHNIRNPLAMLLEAADDISYVTSDLIDAIRKNALSYERFYQELRNETALEVKAFRNNFDAFYQENLNEDIPLPFEYTMQRMINDLKISLIKQVVEVFFKQKDRIFNKGIYYLNKKDADTEEPPCGIWLVAYDVDPNSADVGLYSELLDCIQDATLVRWIRKSLFKKHIYREIEILQNELTGYQVVTSLLDAFVKAVLSLDFNSLDSQKNEFKLSDDNKALLRMEKIYRLISKDFVRVFTDTVTRHKYDQYSFEHVYYRLKLVVDYVSGMTDSYALEIYRTLNGV